ncbi:hypothetical protein [Thermicanus aegyptius]|uniref:hypothetical protein n=1 Tax=Thermicanus aegyptius TaxID=94009 RepID=UPI000416A99F|nr:hypothetical protein [Thermicanus aegyptius]
MGKGVSGFLLLLFLFVTGILIGMQMDREKKGIPTPSDTEFGVNPLETYIVRIENGKPVYAPIHPFSQGNQGEADSGSLSNPQETHVPNASTDMKESDHRMEVGESGTNEGDRKETAPVMAQEGDWDRLGRNLGNQLSSFTQKALERVVGFFVKK